MKLSDMRALLDGTIVANADTMSELHEARIGLLYDTEAVRPDDLDLDAVSSRLRAALIGARETVRLLDQLNAEAKLWSEQPKKH